MKGVSPQLFNMQQLACRCGCSTLKLMPGFLSALVELQEACGVVFPVNSCCRCPAHNERVGGNPRSMHMTVNEHHKLDGTCAIDIGFPEGHEHRELLMTEAWKRGWSIGVHPRFVHLDRRTKYVGLPQTRFKY